MLSENEISAIKNINEDVVNFAYEEAQKAIKSGGGGGN